MIAEAMIKAAAVGGMTMLWSYFTLKTFKICRQIVFPPGITHWCRCEYCSNYFTSDLLTERKGLNCYFYVCHRCCEEKEAVCEQCQERFLDNIEEMGLDNFLCKVRREI